jgi:hypothetical protein
MPLRPLPENVLAVRWLDQRFEPLIARIPPDLHAKLESAEIFHQLLEHRWFLSEAADTDISLEDALASYIADVLVDAPDELLSLGEVTAELPVTPLEPALDPSPEPSYEPMEPPAAQAPADAAPETG